MTEIFISCSRKDIAFARLLVQAVEAQGIDPWIDWLAAVSVVLGVTVLLAFLAWTQRNTALRSEATAVAESNQRATAQVQAEQAGATAVFESLVRATAQAIDKQHSRSGF